MMHYILRDKYIQRNVFNTRVEVTRLSCRIILKIEREKILTLTLTNIILEVIIPWNSLLYQLQF